MTGSGNQGVYNLHNIQIIVYLHISLRRGEHAGSCFNLHPDWEIQYLCWWNAHILFVNMYIYLFIYIYHIYQYLYQMHYQIIYHIYSILLVNLIWDHPTLPFLDSRIRTCVSFISPWPFFSHFLGAESILGDLPGSCWYFRVIIFLGGSALQCFGGSTILS